MIIEACPGAVDAGVVAPPGMEDGRRSAVQAASATVRLAQVRGEIERVDRQMVELLAERVGLARQVGTLKRELGLSIVHPAREAAVVRRAAELAGEAGVCAEDVRSIFWHIIALSRRVQMEEEWASASPTDSAPSPPG